MVLIFKRSGHNFESWVKSTQNLCSFREVHWQRHSTPGFVVPFAMFWGSTSLNKKTICFDIQDHRKHFPEFFFMFTASSSTQTTTKLSIATINPPVWIDFGSMSADNLNRIQWTDADGRLKRRTEEGNRGQMWEVPDIWAPPSETSRDKEIE